MDNKKIIADSSFYICFLDDINNTTFLNLLYQHSFKFLTTKIINDEINKSASYLEVENGLVSQFSFPYNISEILRPFFGKEEIFKGEHEVIALAYVYYHIDHEFIIILDEKGPRKFLNDNFSHLSELMVGTFGFLANCCCEYMALTKDQAMGIIDEITNSKFRVSDGIVENTIQKIGSC